MANGRSSPELIAQLLAAPPATAARLWSVITADGNLGAEIARFAAARRATTFLAERVMQPSNRHSHLARTEIAHNHGFRSWHELQQALVPAPAAWAAIEQAAIRAALGKCVRDVLFESR
jgi:hypothetical protein